MENIKFFWFDMDHTLINNDCDVSWKEFVVKHQLAGPETMLVAEKFFEQYNQGKLDVELFEQFQLEEFVGKNAEEMRVLAEHHFVEFVLPTVYPKAKEMFEQLQAEDKKIGILTATSSVLAQPVATYFKADILFGSEITMEDGKFLNRYRPPYAGGEGKVRILQEFSQATKIPMSQMAYFGDSINDRFVLSAVGHPFATNPSAELLALAQEKNWQIIDFK